MSARQAGKTATMVAELAERLEPGDEATFKLPPLPGRERPRRIRLRVNSVGGLDATGWDGRMTRTLRLEYLETVHRKRKVEKGASAPPPYRRRAR